MQDLFSKNILTVKIPVVGETNNYLVTIKFGGFLDLIKKQLEKQDSNILELRTIIRALIDALNRDDVYIHCNCLHPTTKIKLLDGTAPTAKELKDRFDNGEKLYCYSVDENGDFKPGEIENVWISGNSTNFIKITLDNDREIITTPEHLYLNRQGEYVEAQCLNIGDSLMPLYFNKTSKDYDTIKLNSTNKYHSIYKLVADYFKSKEILEALCRVKESDNMKYDVAIHHKDFNKHNNNPENLQIMTAREHWDYHSNLCGKDRVITDRMRETSRINALKRNANPTERMIEARKEWNRKCVLRNYDSDRKEQQSKLMKQVMKDYYENISEEDRKNILEKLSKESKLKWERGCFDTEAFRDAAKERGKRLHTPDMERLTREGQDNYWSSISEEELKRRLEISKQNIKKAQEKVRGLHLTEEHKEKIRKAKLNKTAEQRSECYKKVVYTKIKNNLLFLIQNNKPLTNENYNKYRKNGSPKITKYFENIDKAVEYFQLNHKVKNIEHITIEDTPVYDISVKKYSNFLVDSGVILHNCDDWRYRMAYFASISDINAGEKENRPSKVTNPDNNLGPGCKHTMLVLANTSWLIKVASVINNYIKYFEKNKQKQYADIIYPAIYGKKYQEPIQLSLEDEEELSSSKDLIDKANTLGRERGRFKPGNPTRFQPQNKQNPNQLELEIEDEI